MAQPQSGATGVQEQTGLAWTTLGLLGTMLLFVARHLYRDARLNDAVFQVIAPGSAAERMWRAITVCGFIVAIALGASAVYWRRTARATRLVILASLVALGAFLTEYRIFGEFGGIMANALPYCCCIVTIASAYRPSLVRLETLLASGNNDLIWIGTALYAIAYALLFRIFGQHSNGISRRPLIGLFVFLAIVLHLTTRRPTRFAAALASGIGTAGALYLLLLSFFPLTYIGFIGFVLLRTLYGWVFYAAGIGGVWAYLRRGRQLRAELKAPSSDGWLGIPVAIALSVAIVTISSLLK